MSQTERRSVPRTPSSVPLDLFDLEGQIVIGEARFVNVSLKGAQIESLKRFPVNETIRFQVQSVGRSPLELTGRVIWVRKRSSGFTHGIEFNPPALKKTLAPQAA